MCTYDEMQVWPPARTVALRHGRHCVGENAAQPRAAEVGERPMRRRSSLWPEAGGAETRPCLFLVERRPRDAGKKVKRVARPWKPRRELLVCQLRTRFVTALPVVRIVFQLRSGCGCPMADRLGTCCLQRFLIPATLRLSGLLHFSQVWVSGSLHVQPLTQRANDTKRPLRCLSALAPDDGPQRNPYQPSTCPAPR